MVLPHRQGQIFFHNYKINFYFAPVLLQASSSQYLNEFQWHIK